MCCSIIGAEFAAAAVLISFGAVLGKVSGIQLLLMALVEVLLFQVNQLIVFDKLQVNYFSPVLLLSESARFSSILPGAVACRAQQLFFLATVMKYVTIRSHRLHAVNRCGLLYNRCHS